MTMTTTETATTQIDQLRHVTAAVTALVEHATPDQLLHDSPCVGWSGCDVLNHMVGSADLFTGPARGEEVPFPDWSAMPDWLGADPARSYRAAADRAIAAYAAPGVLDANVTMLGRHACRDHAQPAHRRPRDPRLGPRADDRHPDQHRQRRDRGRAGDLDSRSDPELPRRRLLRPRAHRARGRLARAAPCRVHWPQDLSPTANPQPPSSSSGRVRSTSEHSR